MRINVGFYMNSYSTKLRVSNSSFERKFAVPAAIGLLPIFFLEEVIGLLYTGLYLVFVLLAGIIGWKSLHPVARAHVILTALIAIGVWLSFSFSTSTIVKAIYFSYLAFGVIVSFYMRRFRTDL